MFIGLDLSLTATGFSILSGGGFQVETIKTDKMRGFERLDFIRSRIRALCVSECKGVGIENYSFGSKFNREAMGELGGVIRLMLWERGLPFVNVAPQALKKFATGRGAGGEKGLIMVEVFKRYGITVADNNQADAIVLAHMAEHHFTGLAPEFSYQKEALSKLETTEPFASPVRKRTRQ